MYFLLATAHAGVGLDLGVGMRQLDNAFSGRRLALNASARKHLGEYFAAEGGISVRLPFGDEASALTQTLIAIAEDGNADNFKQPVNSELLTVAIHAQFSPFKIPHEGKVGMWPYALVGIEARVVEYNFATINPDYVDGVEGALPASIPAEAEDVRVLPSPAIGLGFDVWFVDRVGLRIVVSQRFSVEEEPDYGNKLANGEPEPLDTVLTTSGTAMIGALVRF